MTDVDEEISRVSAALRACWSRWSADPTEAQPWSEANPAAGHCWVSAMILRDHVGGELVEARVERADGSDADWHYWNRFPDGTELDITRDQFRAGERLLDVRVVPAPTQLDVGAMIGPYRLLSGQVTRWLAGETPAGPLPASVRAVCRDEDGRLLVCGDHHGGWELPGGQPAPGEHYTETLVREVAEATGLELTVGPILGVEPLLDSEGWVAIVAYACRLAEANHPPVPSGQHTAAAFLTDSELADASLPAVHRSLSALA